MDTDPKISGKHRYNRELLLRNRQRDALNKMSMIYGGYAKAEVGASYNPLKRASMPADDDFSE